MHEIWNCDARDAGQASETNNAKRRTLLIVLALIVAGLCGVLFAFE